MAVLETRSEKERIAIIPCNSGVFERLIAIPSRPGSFMLAEELILHFLPKVFRKYKIVAKSLIRITRNADIDADSIYDEDLNYRDHMAEVVKLRKKLCPVRMEMTRELDETILRRFCRSIGSERTAGIPDGNPLWIFPSCSGFRMNSAQSRSYFTRDGFQQNSPMIDRTQLVTRRFWKKIFCFLIHMRVLNHS